MRERFPIDESLSLISEVDGVPSGSVWMTPISVGGINGYMLGPLATHPNYRKRGAGKLLAREVSKRALARGEGQFVLLVGDQDYYCPLGWEITTPGNIQFPGPVDTSRVLLLSDDKDMAKTYFEPCVSATLRQSAISHHGWAGGCSVAPGLRLNWFREFRTRAYPIYTLF